MSHCTLVLAFFVIEEVKIWKAVFSRKRDIHSALRCKFSSSILYRFMRRHINSRPGTRFYNCGNYVCIYGYALLYCVDYLLSSQNLIRFQSFNYYMIFIHYLIDNSTNEQKKSNMEIN